MESEMANSGHQPSIIDLSTELLLMIIEHLPLTSHFDFACTCRRLAAASQSVLKRHQEAYIKYRTASDLDPHTVPLLLRSAFGQGDPIPAWHVRSFEVWRDRTTWSDWETMSLWTPPEPVSDCAPSRLRVQRNDVKQYLEWYDRYAEEDSDEDFGEGLDQVDSGNDGLLKALLFSQCPRLKDLKFVTRSQDAGSCLSWMGSLIANCLQDDESSMSDSSHEHDENIAPGLGSTCHYTLPWPVGFFSLSNVAVGVFSGTWMDDRRDEPSTSLFAHLLRLPNIDSIYFNGLGGDDSYEYDEDGGDNGSADEIIPAHCSSVKHIFLHGYNMVGGDFDEAIWGAPRQLLTASLRHDGDTVLSGATGIVNCLAVDQGSTLQDLMWYGYDKYTIQGDHCNVHDAEEFPSFSAMRTVSFSIQDLGLAAYHAGSKDKGDEDDFFVHFAATVFPEAMETLVLWDDPCSGHVNEKIGNPVLLDRAIVKLITDGRYENLKAVFLEDVERTRQGPRKDVLWFQGAIAAGRAAGVDVDTLTNRSGVQHSTKFHEAPDEYDLVSGIHSGVRPDGWIFNPYIGKRVPPGCNRCGDCQQCYLEYDAELWGKIRPV